MLIGQTINIPPSFEHTIEHLKGLAVLYGIRILIALIVVIIGWRIIALLVRAFRRLLEIRDADPTLRPFLTSLVSITLKILLLLTAVSMIGIETTGFVAALGAIGLGIGLALQGSLSNFAGGVLILLFKPFRVGDYIVSQGAEGTVNEINILYTTLITSNNKKILMPNGLVSNNMITNVSAMEMRRLDVIFPISQAADATQAMDIIKAVIDKENRIFAAPPPIVAIDNITDSAVKIAVYVWVDYSELFDIKFSINKAVIEGFHRAGIRGPLNAALQNF